MHKLVIQDDEGKTTVVPLIRDEITVGRKEGNTIRLTERNVSRKHARIVRQNGSIAVEDLNSYNGVRVNGSRIQGLVGVSLTDRIQIGDYLIELKADNGVVATDQPYGEETQPVDTADLRGSAPHIPVPQNLADQEMPTTKMPSPITAIMPGLSMPPTAAAEVLPPPAMPPPVQEASFARLVILSSNFAGREFEMTKPAMVIGRTDDNDLVVNHRSISRHHAKIVREGDRYAIMDLQSSNGVRVNGEEYSKVELRRGDVIDLGHVRLRFVEPGEDFVFGRDAHAVSLPSAGGRGMIYALGAVLIAGAVLVFALTRGGDEGGQAGASVDEPSEIAGGPPPEADQVEVPSIVQEPEVDDDLKPHLDMARSAINADDWATAIKSTKDALAIQPQSDEARQLLSKAELEQENFERFNAFQRAVKKRKLNHREVATAFEVIDDDSIYKNRAREDHDRLRDEFTRRAVEQAEDLARRGRCKELGDLETRTRAAWATAGDEVAAVTCTRPQPVATRDTTRRDTSSDSGSTTRDTTTTTTARTTAPVKDDDDGGSSSSSKPSKSYDELMEEARAAAKANEYGRAQRLCADALKHRPRDPEAATLCGLAACNLKNANLAKRYQNMVPPQRKQIIRQFCLKAGLRDFQ